MKVKPFRATSVVEFTCPPQAEGKACVSVGALFAATLGLWSVVHGVKTQAGMVFVFAVSAAIAGYGVYLWRFRRKPFRRRVNLGGLQHRLYLRSRWMFLVFELVLTSFILIVAFSVVTLVFDGVDTYFTSLSDRLRRWVGLLLLLYYHVVRDYLSYYTYLRSPVESRRKIA